MNHLDEILERIGCSKRVKPLNYNFDTIEELIKFKLPEDYKYFIQNYEGYCDSIGNQFVILQDGDELLEYNIGYNIFTNLPKTLAIGGNGGGEFIALEMTENNILRVIISPFIDLSNQYHIEIGNSFTDFLSRLEGGENWFKT
jgi:SMI1-KNR4 cell-wall